MIIICAAATLAAVIVAGRNAPIFLLLMFIVWDLSPFAAVGLTFRSDHPAFRLMSLSALILSPVLTAAVWYFVIWPRPAQPAAPFMIIPAMAWLVVVIIAVFSYLQRK